MVEKRGGIRGKEEKETVDHSRRYRGKFSSKML